jgi:N-dimethylarginine dimethylaminohydrolase
VLAEQAFIDAGAIASSNRATNGVSVGLLYVTSPQNFPDIAAQLAQ